MRTFEKMAAQGDLLIRRIGALPEGLTEVPAENGLVIVAHSETGHHHALKERPDIKYYKTMDQLRAYLVVDNAPADLEHHRSFDTHETIRVDPGIYELRRQREYTPEGFRRVED